MRRAVGLLRVVLWRCACCVAGRRSTLPCHAMQCHAMHASTATCFLQYTSALLVDAMVICGKRQRTVGAAAGGWVAVVSRAEQLHVLTGAGFCPARPAAGEEGGQRQPGLDVRAQGCGWMASLLLLLPASAAAAARTLLQVAIGMWLAQAVD